LIRINGPLLKALIQNRFRGGVSELMSMWDPNGGPHRSTVHRWTRGSFPQSREDMLRLCALLDVDPFYLVLPEREDALDAANHLAYAFQNDHWKPALAFIKDFMGRRSEWPPKRIATNYFRRSWVTRELVHDPSVRSNYYATIEISSGQQGDRSWPQTFHFAYRHPTLFGKRWLHFGLVVRHGLAVRLMHINGYTHSSESENLTDATLVETFYGQGNAIFRVASLHPFSLRVIGHENSTRATVRFPA